VEHCAGFNEIGHGLVLWAGASARVLR